MSAADIEQRIGLPGHVLPALGSATTLPRYAGADRSGAPDSPPLVAESPLTLTIVLNRSDQEGFEGFVREVQDPSSPSFRRFLSQEALAHASGMNDRNRIARGSRESSGGSDCEDSAFVRRLSDLTSGTLQ